MPFQLPAALHDPDDDTGALALLRRYYSRTFAGSGSAVGATFDTWDSTGTRTADADRFTAHRRACGIPELTPSGHVSRGSEPSIDL